MARVQEAQTNNQPNKIPMAKNVNGCTKPDCDCIAKAEEKNGGNPVKQYECLGGVKAMIETLQGTKENTLTPIARRIAELKEVIAAGTLHDQDLYAAKISLQELEQMLPFYPSSTITAAEEAAKDFAAKHGHRSLDFLEGMIDGYIGGWNAKPSGYSEQQMREAYMAGAANEATAMSFDEDGINVPSDNFEKFMASLSPDTNSPAPPVEQATYTKEDWIREMMKLANCWRNGHANGILEGKGKPSNTFQDYMNRDGKLSGLKKNKLVLHPVNYGGYITIQDGPKYGDKDLLDEETFPGAETFANELCDLWNAHHDIESDEHPMAEYLLWLANRSIPPAATTVQPSVSIEDYREIVEVAKGFIAWCDAVPQDTLLPDMPGVDRDHANEVIFKATEVLNANNTEK